MSGIVHVTSICLWRQTQFLSQISRFVACHEAIHVAYKKLYHWGAAEIDPRAGTAATLYRRRAVSKRSRGHIISLRAA